MNKLYLAIIGLLVLLLMLQQCNGKRKTKNFQKDLAKNAVLIKEKDGQYAKLVDNVNSERSLRKQFKAENEDLHKQLKDKGERLLYYQSVIASFVPTKDTTILYRDTGSNGSDFIFTLNYPKENSFITYDGKIFVKSSRIQGEWSFDKLPLKIVLTETSTGNWNSRIVGPDYFVVTAMEVEALPPDKMTDVDNIDFIGGLTYGRNMSSQANFAGLNVGARYKRNSLLLFGYTNNTAGATFLRNF